MATLKKFMVFGVMTLLVLALALAARPTEKPGAQVVLPPQAVEVAPDVYFLGTAVVDGRIAEGYAYIHRAPTPETAHGKPGTCKDDGKCSPWEAATCGDCAGGGDPGNTTDGDASCYGFMAKGLKWKSVEPWVVNPSGSGLSMNGTFVLFDEAITKWEAAAGSDVLGAGSLTLEPLILDTVAPDGVNEAYFGSIAEPGVIAITNVWGYFNAPPPRREIIEWDQVYDNVDYVWATDGRAGAMDAESVITHELGHSFGMDDLYTSLCSEETMYGYTAEGETKKRDLAAGDIAGIAKLY